MRLFVCLFPQMWTNVMCRVPVSTSATILLVLSSASVTRVMSWQQTQSPAKVNTNSRSHTHPLWQIDERLRLRVYFPCRHRWMQFLQLYVPVPVRERSWQLLLRVSRGISAPGKQAVSRCCTHPFLLFAAPLTLLPHCPQWSLSSSSLNSLKIVKPMLTKFISKPLWSALSWKHSGVRQHKHRNSVSLCWAVNLCVWWYFLKRIYMKLQG